MILAISTIVLAGLIAAVVIAERRHSRKAAATFGRYDEMLEDLEGKARSSYIKTFGKEPTGSFPKIRDKDKS